MKEKKCIYCLHSGKSGYQSHGVVVDRKGVVSDQSKKGTTYDEIVLFQVRKLGDSKRLYVYQSNHKFSQNTLFLRGKRKRAAQRKQTELLNT